MENESVSGCCEDTPSRKCEKAKAGWGTGEGRTLSLLLKEEEEAGNEEGAHQRCCWRKYSSMIS